MWKTVKTAIFRISVDKYNRKFLTSVFLKFYEKLFPLKLFNIYVKSLL